MKIKPKLIADDLISVTPLPGPPEGTKIYEEDGDIVHERPSGLKVTYTSKPTEFEAGEYGHSFVKGWFIANEEGNLVYLYEDSEEFLKLYEKYHME